MCIPSHRLSMLPNKLELHVDHQAGNRIHHNAGFDSLNTAKVLLKLIANYHSKLLQEGNDAQAEKNARVSLVNFINKMGHYDPDTIPPEVERDFVLPPFQSRFWAGFINRLRCNGVEPNVMVLDDEEGGVKLDL